MVVTNPDGGVSARGLGAWLTAAAPRRARGEVTIALVSDGRMAALNRTFRGHDAVTDVLSFAVSSPEAPDALGDIVIAAGVARRQAREAGHSFLDELKILALHGLLHLLGYDHARDAGQMKRLETRLGRAAGLEDGLIERGARARRRSPRSRP